MRPHTHTHTNTQTHKHTRGNAGVTIPIRYLPKCWVASNRFFVVLKALLDVPAVVLVNNLIAVGSVIRIIVSVIKVIRVVILPDC